MDFKDKSELRAFLAKQTATVTPVSSLRGISPPSIDEYVHALRSIEKDITPIQREMLIAHAQAPEQVVTMTQLAALAGKGSFHSANSQYGKLGSKLVGALGIASPKWKVYAIAGFDDDSKTGESRAHMYPALRAALQQLGWVQGKSLIQAPQVSTAAFANDEQQTARTVNSSMLSIHEVITALEQHGFVLPNQSGLKVVRLEHPALPAPLFVKQSSSIHARLQAPLVLHPSYEEQLTGWLSIPGIERGHARYYHNSNLRGFPKRRNGGATDIAFGVDLGFQHMAALEQFLASLTGIVPISAAPAASIVGSVIPDDLDTSHLALNDTERDALIKVRIGQGAYRDALLAYWGGCAITDCTVPALLRASHIKPWREASASERLDPYNGLLLTPNLDLAFDQGLISFDDQGQILLGEDLDPDSARALNITPELRLRQIESRHRDYLAWHREHLFRK